MYRSAYIQVAMNDMDIAAKTKILVSLWKNQSGQSCKANDVGRAYKQVYRSNGK